MPETTLTACEKQVLESAESAGVEISRSQQKRIARERFRQMQRRADVSKERLVMHSDPTPCEALHHLLGRSPCRRCGHMPTGARRPTQQQEAAP